MAIGFAAGILSGLIGIGGAILMVPGMIYFLGISQHMAQATSLAVIIPGAVVSAVVYYSYGQLNIHLSLLFAVGGVVGAYIGSSIMPLIKPDVLRKIFAAVAMAMAIKMGVS